MAEHPVTFNESKPVKILVRQPGSQGTVPAQAQSVVDNKPEIADPKKTVSQKLSKYAFGEEVAQPGKYIFDSYLAPTGKRVANDIVEHFLIMIKNTFQRWIWNGKTLDNGNWVGDRTSFSNYSRRNEPIKASVMMSPVKELTFSTKAEAERVLASLRQTMAEENGMVTVREYYETSGCPELVESSGVSSSSGWKDLSKVTVKDNPDGGYSISLPRPVSLS